MSGPSIYLTLPHLSLFKFPPDTVPRTLPAPHDEHTFRSPFAIRPDIYNFVLNWELPLTFAAVYVVSVFALNSYNKTQEYQPWSITKYRAFKWFVILHNVLLAIFSAATFVAMSRAINHTWPGLNNPNGPAGVADALCKIHGPRGLGDAAFFNTTTNIWEIKNQLIHLGVGGNPDPTDVGRLWNEGLAFWGWWFYVSKFYEVIDTLIIITKGKRSATLQTYHHAGAMVCMWAGMRFMSPPIWMFVFINSAIHAMMYTYFALSALGYRVPQSVKRTLTTLQIAQFVFGASYAAAHLFVKYDVPVQSAYQVATTVQSLASSATSAVKEAVETATESAALPIASMDIGALAKKFLLRAAGEEGVAENVRDRNTGQLISPGVAEKVQHFNEEKFETRYRTDWQTVDCIDTTGEACAIYLNLFYLLPLTALFVRFFVRAYTQRSKNRRASQIAKESGRDARESARDTNAEVERLGEKGEDKMQEGGSEIKKDLKDIQEQLRNDVADMKAGKFRDRRVSDRVQSFEGKIKSTAEQAKDKIKEMTNGSGSGSPRRGGSPQKKQQQDGESAIVDDVKEKAEETKEQVKEKAGEAKDKTSEQAQETKDQAKDKAEQAKDESSKKADETQQKGQDKAKQASDSSKDAAKKGEQKSSNGQEKPKQAPDSSKDASKKGEQKASDGKDKGQQKGSPSKKKPHEKAAEAKKQQSGKSSGDKENKAPSKDDAKDTEQSEEKQDANMADSQATRPGASQEGEDEGASANKDAGDEETHDDTDAMGKSGSIIDLASEKAKEASDKNNEGKGEDPTASAEGDGKEWKPPGTDGS